MRVGEDRPLLEVVKDVEMTNEISSQDNRPLYVQFIEPADVVDSGIGQIAVIVDMVAIVCLGTATLIAALDQKGIPTNITGLWIAGGITGALGAVLTGIWIAKDCNSRN